MLGNDLDMAMWPLQILNSDEDSEIPPYLIKSTSSCVLKVFLFRPAQKYVDNQVVSLGVGGAGILATKAGR